MCAVAEQVAHLFLPEYRSFLLKRQLWVKFWPWEMTGSEKVLILLGGFQQGFNF
jgi:S-formylglutathione hydrolase FrmB